MRGRLLGIICQEVAFYLLALSQNHNTLRRCPGNRLLHPRRLGDRRALLRQPYKPDMYVSIRMLSVIMRPSVVAPAGWQPGLYLRKLQEAGFLDADYKQVTVHGARELSALCRPHAGRRIRHAHGGKPAHCDLAALSLNRILPPPEQIAHLRGPHITGSRTSRLLLQVHWHISPDSISIPVGNPYGGPQLTPELSISDCQDSSECEHYSFLEL